MADNNNNISSNNNQFITDYIETMSLDQQGLLQSIDLTLKSIARSDGIKISQSSLKDLMVAEQKNDAVIERNRRQRQVTRNDNSSSQSTDNSNQYRRKKDSQNNWFEFDKRTGKARAGKMWEEVVDSFEETLIEELTGTKNPFDAVFKNLADGLMKSFDAKKVEDLGPQMAKKLMGQLDKIPYTQIFGKQQTTLGNQMRMEMNWYKQKVNTVLNAGVGGVTSKLFGADWNNIDFFSNNESPADEPIVETTETFRDETNRNLRDIYNAIWQSNAGHSGPELGNEFDDAGDNIVDSITDLGSNIVADIPYEEITGQPELGGTQSGDGGVGDIINNALGGEGGIGDVISDGLGGAVDDILGGSGLSDLPALIGNTSTELSTAVGGLGEVAGAAGAAGEGIAALGAAVPELSLALLAAGVALDLISDQLNVVIGPAIQGVKDFIDGLINAFNRDITANSKYLELQRKRNEADIKSIREAAYKVIEDAANRVMQVWDNIETTIAATQVIDKAGVQDLWSAYASRLKSEGLASVVSSADIMEKLQSVLQQGLQGAVAEEFAYQATLLNSAIPTEDFFQYASTYASIAANAIKTGKSQQDAIELATSEMQNFANNLLYASREVAGGFTTSLVNSAELFEKATDIALTAHQSDTTEISRALTTIAGSVGAIAPDLASSVVDAVYKAAVGGNSSDITALRSMAGVGASNTAFLQALARNPQAVLSTMFSNLAQLQNMSSANYMEVAEGLSSIFGMSLKDFARVDFNYLASAIANMSTSSTELEENMKLLADGQTTSNDSQQRMQKINEYMIEEGLAYVLDNQVARSIQEHMWEEQLARDIMEAMYAVDFAGGAKSMMSGIWNTLKGIVDLINPLGWVKKVGNIALTALEASAQSGDLKQIVELGKVGSGNSEAYHNLTTSGKYLGLATPVVELLGGVSEQSAIQDLLTLNNAVLSGQWGSDAYNTGGVVNSVKDLGKQATTAVSNVVSSVTDAVGSVVDSIKKSSASTQSALSSYASATTSSVSDVVNNVVSKSAVATIAKGNVEGVAEAAKGTAEAVVTAQKGVVQGILEKAKGVIQTDAALLKGAWNTLTTGSTDAWKESVESAKSINEASSAEAKRIITDAYQEASNIQSNSLKNASDIVTSAYNSAKEKATNYFNKGIVGKTISSLISSGDWRTNQGFNAYYQNYGDSGTDYYETPTQADAASLSDLLNTSIKKYINEEKEVASSLDNLRKEMTEDREGKLTQSYAKQLATEGAVLHRGFYSNQDVLDQVLSKADEIAAEEQETSFEDWLEKFQNETGIGNLSALLSDYGETIDTIEEMYLTEQAARQNALTKARDLHEVQFWEDMQNFATVDFPAYMREWERYYIQHEAYTEASNQAYMDAVSLSVAEKGEMGDSVLALAQALTENSLWVEELGDKIKDPQLHTNVILSKILLVVEAIMQQNNETSIVSVPTALSSLGLGISNG